MPGVMVSSAVVGEVGTGTAAAVASQCCPLADLLTGWTPPQGPPQQLPQARPIPSMPCIMVSSAVVGEGEVGSGSSASQWGSLADLQWGSLAGLLRRAPLRRAASSPSRQAPW